MGGNDLPTVLCLWGEVVKFYDIKQLNRETTELTEYTSTLSLIYGGHSYITKHICEFDQVQH